MIEKYIPTHNQTYIMTLLYDTFEIDHKIRLEHGGGNDVTNLVALCRECHGQKTAMENM